MDRIYRISQNLQDYFGTVIASDPFAYAQGMLRERSNLPLS